MLARRVKYTPVTATPPTTTVLYPLWWSSMHFRTRSEVQKTVSFLYVYVWIFTSSVRTLHLLYIFHNEVLISIRRRSLYSPWSRRCPPPTRLLRRLLILIFMPQSSGHSEELHDTFRKKIIHYSPAPEGHFDCREKGERLYRNRANIIVLLRMGRKHAVVDSLGHRRVYLFTPEFMAGGCKHWNSYMQGLPIIREILSRQQ